MARAEIHPTAIVHPDAQIHESCSIGPFCTVDKHVKLGPDCRLISHVIIQNRVTAGTGNAFHPFSVIGGIPQDLKYRGEDSELVIGNNNIIRELVTLNIGTTAGGNVTRIGNNNLLMAYVHIAHDSTVGNNVVVGNSCQIAGHVVLEDWATIGGVTGVSQYLRVGAHCYIGGCSGVDRDVPPFTFGRGPTGGFEILGINLVGLRRRGFSNEDIAALQEVNRIFFKDKGPRQGRCARTSGQGAGECRRSTRFHKIYAQFTKGNFSLDMEIFVSAVEASSDTHCAHLIQELKAAKPDITTFGLGGNELAKTGTELLMHNREFAGGGGPLEMISQILPRQRLKERLRSRLEQKRPDGAILVDAGEINLKLAPVLRHFQIPTVYFIPPKVWVWRASRLATIAKNVDLVLSILPFESQIYQRRNIPFQYVGNPLLDEVPLKLTQMEAKAKLQIDAQQSVLTVLPGSRHNEIRFQLEFFAECVKVFMRRLPESDPKPLILIPAAPIIEPASIAEAFSSRLAGTTVKVVNGQSHACIKAARVAFIKSGTSTLEAALLQVPMVLAYHSSPSAEWVFRHIVRYRGFVGLVNLFLESNSDAALGIGNERPAPVVPEMILDRCKPELIAQELIEIYREGGARDRMLKEFSRTSALLLPPPQLGKSPIQAAANAAWGVFERRSRRH